MKNDLRDSALWAMIVSLFSAIMLLSGTIITAFHNRKAKEKEIESDNDRSVHEGLTEISKQRRESLLDCQSELKEEKTENTQLREHILEIEKERSAAVAPHRRRAEKEKTCRIAYEETLLAHDLICLYPPPESD